MHWLLFLGLLLASPLSTAKASQGNDSSNIDRALEKKNHHPLYCQLKMLPRQLSSDCNFPKPLKVDCKDAGCIDTIIKQAQKLERKPCVKLRMRQLFVLCHHCWNKTVNQAIKDHTQRKKKPLTPQAK